ncbi:hypothetical protein D3C78_1845810 [compost metagenome]
MRLFISLYPHSRLQLVFRLRLFLFNLPFNTLQLKLLLRSMHTFKHLGILLGGDGTGYCLQGFLPANPA